MIYGVFGPRDCPAKTLYDNYAYIARVMQTFRDDIDGIIVGGGKGVEQLVERWAREHSLLKECIPPMGIAEYGMASAFKTRNVKIIEKSQRIIVFWDGTPHQPILAAMADSMVLRREVTLIPLEVEG